MTNDAVGFKIRSRRHPLVKRQNGRSTYVLRRASSSRKPSLPRHVEISGAIPLLETRGHGSMDLNDSRESCDILLDLALKVGIENITAVAKALGTGRAPRSADVSDQQTDPDEGMEAVIAAQLGQRTIVQTRLLGRLCADLAVTAGCDDSTLGNGSHVPAARQTDQWRRTTDPADDMGWHLKTCGEPTYVWSRMATQGTAFASRIEAEDMRMAGKTGTAQVRSAVVDNKECMDQRHPVCRYAPYDNRNTRLPSGGTRRQQIGFGSASARDVTLQALVRAHPRCLPIQKARARTFGTNATKSSGAKIRCRSEHELS